MKVSVCVLAAAALLVTGEARAQADAVATPAPATLAQYLESNFAELVASCAPPPRRFQRSWRPSGPLVPATLRNGLRGADVAPYQELPGRTLTDLYGAIWVAADEGHPAEFGTYRRIAGTELGLRFSESDDRVVYGEADTARHTHNCSTVVSLAARAGARVPAGVLEAALSASHDNSSNKGLSLVSGTFRSPIWSALTTEPGRAASRENRSAAYAALWQWYAADPSRAETEGTHYVLDEFEGLALYKFTGLTWKTSVEGSASAGGSYAIVSANASVRGRLDVSGSTTTNNFSVLRFERSRPLFRPLPSVAEAAGRLAQTADFTQVGDWAQLPITNTEPVRLVHEVALPEGICNAPSWTANEAVSSLDVRSVPVPEGEREMCRFTAMFLPPASPPASGAVPIAYEATLAFLPPASTPDPNPGADRNLNLVVGAGETLADVRSRVSLLPTPEGRLERRAGGGLEGHANYRIRSQSGTTVAGFGSQPSVYLACEGEDPQLAIAEVELVQTTSSQGPEARIQILDARTTRWELLSRLGGSCRISGQIDAMLAGVATPVALDIGARTFQVPADEHVLEAVPQDLQERLAVRLNATTPIL